MSIKNLFVYNLSPGKETKNLPDDSIVIHTCQRTIIAGINSPDKYDLPHEIYLGTSAYKFLLSVICGLESKIIAEYEIVAQFKNAYQNYLSKEEKCRNTTLCQVIEKLFKDSKEVRTKHLLGISHESYAGVAKKIFKNKIVDQQKNTTITVLGSGHLAEDIIKNFKKNFNILIVSRNQDRLEQLKKDYQIETLSLSDYHAFTTQPYIINTIGSKDVLFDENNFFSNWRASNLDRLFLDLGSPSSINYEKDPFIYSLTEFFNYSEKLNNEKSLKVDSAKKLILEISHKRYDLFEKKYIGQMNFNPRYVVAF